MVLYGYDASVFNSVQGSNHWLAYFNHPGPNIIGAINTAYTVGAVVAGFFFGGPLADYAGRRVGMATGAALVIIATFMQTFTPRGNVACFIGGRVLIGMGQGLALSMLGLRMLGTGLTCCSCWADLHWGDGAARDSRHHHVVLADVLLGWVVPCVSTLQIWWYPV
jgi:MFS family permease